MLEVTRKSFCPTVLLVDDDSAVTEYFSERFLEDTSIGVVVANTLPKGKAYIDDPRIKIDAVLADLHFDRETDDPRHDLFDGIDFLAYTNSRRPHLINYALSYFSEKKAHREKAEKNGIPIKRWMHKMYVPRAKFKTPWKEVELDLIRDRWENDARIKDLKKAKVSDEQLLAEYARTLDPITKTYLQSLTPEYNVLKPIEVYCERRYNGTEGPVVRASAPRLGLLRDGEGGTVEEALEDLATIITSQIESFNEDQGRIVGYADLVRKRLSEHIARKPLEVVDEET